MDKKMNKNVQQQILINAYFLKHCHAKWTNCEKSGNSANLHIIKCPSVSSTDRPQVLYIFEKVIERASR